MKKLITFFKRPVVLWIVLLMVLIFPSFMDLFRTGFYSMHDDLQAFRIHQMHECMKDLQIPCRWVPDAGYQFGYPLFNYYPPSAYYIGELGHLLFNLQFIDTVKLVFIFGFVTSALAMFLLLRSVLNNNFAAVIGGVMYTYAPYKAVDVYVRGAMSEFFALIFFPLIFWAIYQLIKTEKIKYMAFLGLSIGGLLLSHNLMTLIFIPVAGIWALVWLVFERNWRVIIKLIAGGLLGLGLAAFFSFPVVMEREYAHLESLVGGYFDYRLHYVNLEQLFISNYWGYGSSVWGNADEISMSTGPLHALIGILAVLLSVVLFQKNKQISIVCIVMGVVELWVLFMMHQRSSFLWAPFEFLAYLQFPWRFLGVSIFLLSLQGGILVYYFSKTKLVYLLGGIIVVSLLLIHLPFFKGHAWKEISDKEKFSGASWEKQLTISIFDYLPIYAKLPPIKKAPDKPEILEGKAEILNYTKGSNYQYGEYKVTEEAKVRAPIFDYPGMRVMVDGKVVKHYHDECRGQEFCLGLVTFDLLPGEYKKVEIKLTDTPIRTVGNWLSLVSLVVIGFIFIKDAKYFKK